MPNFVKIFCQIKKFYIQGLDFDRSVCMTAISNCGPIPAIPENERPLGEKRTCAKFQIDISKTEGLVRVYTDGRTWLVSLSSC